MIEIKRYPVILTQFHEVKHENLVDNVLRLCQSMLGRLIRLVHVLYDIWDGTLFWDGN